MIIETKEFIKNAIIELGARIWRPCSQIPQNHLVVVLKRKKMKLYAVVLLITWVNK